jgi:DNA-binding transcriptional ArsR family regulator
MERRPATPEEARALANPLRLRILRLCLDRELTNEELAARLGRDAGSVLHHVRLLVDTGFLEPRPERRGRRGAMERPYRATGKSWTLDVGEGSSITMALVDAFRAEIAEALPADIVSTTRLGVRLRPDARDAFRDRFQALMEELRDADDPAGEPYGYFLGIHRRQEHEVAGSTPPGAKKERAKAQSNGRRPRA